MTSPWQRALDSGRSALEAALAARATDRPACAASLDRAAAACARAAALCVPPAWREQAAQAAARCAEAARMARAGGAPDADALTQLCDALAGQARPEYAEQALALPLDTLPGVGPVRAQQLAARGFETLGDLLFHLPARYDDRRSLDAVGELEVGRHATFVAQVRSCELGTSSPRRGRPRRVLQAVVGDATGTLVLKWFRFNDRLPALLEKGVRLLATGDVRRYRFHKEIVHPEIEILDAGEDAADAARALAAHRRLVPVYPPVEGVAPRTLRRWIAAALSSCGDCVPGYWPAGQQATAPEDAALPEPAEALQRVHAPERDADARAYRDFAAPAQRRLVLEELYLLELGLALRHAGRAAEPGVPIDVARSRAAGARLPFALTPAQQRALDEIRADLARPHPMSRLLQGDVGSGKTAVAFLAAVAACADGHQAAFMAPTELLAEQHQRTLEALAAGLPQALRPRIGLLTASQPRAEAARVRAALAAGEIDLAVGTHALLQQEVRFARLALAVIDEQHRFGVKQRAALAGRGEGSAAPHVLVMTATPIPRTLALTLYGDLDLSVIDALPPGRQPTRTLLLREGEGRAVADLVRETLDRGEQVYVVYPLVEESERVDLRAAVQSAGRIARAFPDVRVDLVHGRQPPHERSAAMARFESGQTRILVSTTVIEVGVDVANATLLVVEHAERFGLAQLHQLRGRVGRGRAPGTCVLVARGGGEDSEARLAAMLETTDGFRIADADLRIRGPGEFLGTRQSGHLPELRVADLLRDARWLARAREAAFAAVRSDPRLDAQPALRRAVALRWGARLALGGVG